MKKFPYLWDKLRNSDSVSDSEISHTYHPPPGPHSFWNINRPTSTEHSCNKVVMTTELSHKVNKLTGWCKMVSCMVLYGLLYEAIKLIDKLSNIRKKFAYFCRYINIRIFRIVPRNQPELWFAARNIKRSLTVTELFNFGLMLSWIKKSISR